MAQPYFIALLFLLPAAGAPVFAQQPAMQPQAGSVQAPQPTLELATLLPAVQKGGLVLYFRHGPTDWNQKDLPGAPDTPCNQQRNLSDSGRTVVGAAAAAMRQLQVPVAEVLASKYCRCQQTAELLFGKVQADHRVTGLAPRAGLDSLLATAPTTGNRMIVSHQDMLRDYFGIRLAEGEAAVFQPGTPPVFLGRIPLAQWVAWQNIR